LALAESVGAHLHICHVSAKESAVLLKQAKERGVRASGEATPHHLCLCDEDVPGDDGNYKMSPPLRSRKDMLALRQALKDGVIEVIATDHAPHAESEKSLGFAGAPFGIAGLETALGLCVTELVLGGVINPYQLIEKLSSNPARILGLEAGALTPGFPADITIVDWQAKQLVEPERFWSKGKNTPFGGRVLSGVAKYTIIDGRVVYSHGN
jgi:dihydroorotase